VIDQIGHAAVVLAGADLLGIAQAEPTGGATKSLIGKGLRLRVFVVLFLVMDLGRQRAVGGVFTQVLGHFFGIGHSRNSFAKSYAWLWGGFPQRVGTGTSPE